MKEKVTGRTYSQTLDIELIWMTRRKQESDYTRFLDETLGIGPKKGTGRKDSLKCSDL